MTREKTTLCRGDIVDVDLDPAEGSEMNKTRPCLVITNNTANRYSPVVTVVAITSQEPNKPYPFVVEVPKSANMPKRSWVNCAHLRTVDKSRLKTRYYTSLDKDTMDQVNQALKDQLGIP